jgi:L-histidine N-alpha-methyltransferase
MLMDVCRAQPAQDRLIIERTPSATQALTFADDVRIGLSAQPKHLGPKWLYDDLGSALFDAICKLPEYDLTRVEATILSAHAGDIIASFAEPLDLFELGSGSSVKTRYLLDAIFGRQPELHYQPIDISDDALVTASHGLIAHYPNLSITAHAGDYYSVLEQRGLPRARRSMVTFLGSNIGNYEPAEAQRLLRAISKAIEPGDALLLGVDLKKDAELLTAAYDDPTGVTAAFIKNILGRMNRELGANFDLRAFTHRVDYDEASGAVNSYLEALSEQTVNISSLNQIYSFAKSERVHVESSYKFSFTDLTMLGERSGFSLKGTWTDQQQRFGEALFIKR